MTLPKNSFLFLMVILVILVILINLPIIISNVQSIFSASPTITSSIILDRVQRLSQLTTVRYNYSSLVTSEREMPGVLGVLYGEKQVMVAVGHVNAGVNLADLGEESIIIEDNQILIELPAPVLQDCFLNEQSSYIVSRDTGIFAQGSPNLDTEGRRYAVRQFRNSALSEGILVEAQQQTKVVIDEFLNLFLPDRGPQLVVTVADPDPESLLPASCQ